MSMLPSNFPAPMKLARFALAAALLAQPLTAAFAADWQLVLSDRSRRVEIDRGSIFVSDGGTKVSWSRVVLSPTEAAQTGYAAIRALNRYDCRNRSFSTIKRLYLDAASNVVREEEVVDQTPQVVTRNSVDERMWREVCNPPTSAADLQNIANQVATLATASTAAATAAPTAPPAPPAGEGREASILPPLPDLRAAAAEASPPPPPPQAVEPPPAVPAVTPPAPPPAAAAPAPTPPAEVAEAVRRAVAQTPRRTEARPERRPAPRAEARAQPRAAAAPRPANARPAPQRAAAARPPAPGPDWTYADGPNGPQNWGKLRPEWKLCSTGTRQSPIDLREGVAVDLAPVVFDYRPSAFLVRDTGKMLQVDVVEDMGMEVRGTRYALQRFALHRPSQDRIGGQAEDMAIYFEHRSASGKTAILSVPLSASGAANNALQTLWNNLPLDRGGEFLPPATLDLAGFLPASNGHYLYQGSLPTPPCTEDVLWVVMKEPVTISPEQFAVFSRLYPRSGRPIQPTNGRMILESR